MRLTEDQQRLVEQFIADHKGNLYKVALAPTLRAKTSVLFMRSNGASEDDISSIVSMGIVDAAFNYDPSKGTKFRTYAYWRVRKWISKEVRAYERHASRVVNATIDENKVSARDSALLRVPTCKPLERKQSDEVGVGLMVIKEQLRELLPKLNRRDRETAMQFIANGLRQGDLWCPSIRTMELRIRKIINGRATRDRKRKADTRPHRISEVDRCEVVSA